MLASSQRKMSKRLLVLHYSLTGQADLASQIAVREAERSGWDVTARSIVFAPDERHPLRPFRVSDAAFWTKAAQKGTIFRVQLDRDIPEEERFDGALIFSNTWGDCPAAPVRSFLSGTQAKTLLSGVPCGLFIVCRRLWLKNASASQHLIEDLGGRVIETVPLLHPGSQIGSLVQTVTHMFRSGSTGLSSIFGIPLPPFGLSRESKNAIAPATARMLETMDAH